MAQKAQQTSYELAKRELLALDRAAGNRLHCTSGEIWITREGSQQDIILKPGESWLIEDAAAVVASALCASKLVVTHPQSTRPRVAPRQLAASILLLVRRWQHRPLSGYPSTMLR